MLLVGYIAGNFRVFFHPLLSWVKVFFIPQFFFCPVLMNTQHLWQPLPHGQIVKYFCRAGLGRISVQQRFFGSIYGYLEGIYSDL